MRAGLPRRGALATLLVVAALIVFGASAGAADRSDAPQPPTLTPGSYAPGEVLAQFHEPAVVDELAALGLTLVEHYAHSDVTRLRTDADDPTTAISRLLASGLVCWAEANARLHVAQLIPDDPRYGEQAGYWELLGAPTAWQITTGSHEVVVAVIDGAVDFDHPDLAGAIWINEDEIPGNGIDDDENGFVDDVNGYDFVGDFPGHRDGTPGEDNDPNVVAGDTAAGDGIDQDGSGLADDAVGHGTRVAGIIAARGNDGIGIPGTAWQVRVMPVRVTDPEGNGFFSSFVRALEYATVNEADIVNISLAASSLPQASRAAVAAAHAAGLVIVGAAGNTGDQVTFPAALSEIVAVGSHESGERVDERASFSPRRAGVDLVAPGRNVLTTDVRAETATPDYIAASGTSFSAPFVSGAMALALSIEPLLDRDQLVEMFLDTATDLPDGVFPDWDGAGRLNIGAALADLTGSPPLPPEIESIDLDDPGGDYLIRGRARAGSRVDLQESPGQASLGAGTADADGYFEISLPPNRIPETQALLTVAGLAVDGDEASELSGPITFSLPRIVTLWPGWNLVAWAGLTGPGVDVLRDLPAQVDRVFAWAAAGWSVAGPGNSALTIDRIAAGDGLWIFLEGTQPAEWQQRRAPILPTTLDAGWNLRAWTGPSGAGGDVLAAAPGALEAFFLWDAIAVAHLGYFAAAPSLGAVTDVAHLDALWLLLGENGALWPGS